MWRPSETKRKAFLCSDFVLSGCPSQKMPPFKMDLPNLNNLNKKLSHRCVQELISWLIQKCVNWQQRLANTYGYILLFGKWKSETKLNMTNRCYIHVQIFLPNSSFVQGQVILILQKNLIAGNHNSLIVS